MNALTVCRSCGASAEVCQLKHHFGGRDCCEDCHHDQEVHG